MAAGREAVSGHSCGSSAVLESTLDRRFQGVTNTTESIQGLSTWCIENKKYHSVIVRYWMKWLRKSDASHRLNLFYLANDVIQNCKRKNAIVYRTTFTEVLPEAIKLINTVKDSKVRKSVDRILTIWEERNVYSEEFINLLRSGLVQRDELPVSANQNETLRSKIVAEFVPSAFSEHLNKYRNSMDEIELREKQLAAMRVDVCSTEALKKLKDKAGGKRFSRDFEDGSTKLQDFVTFLDGQVKKGPSLLEALENADIFYEMQYKEVKIVTKAYQTFANRVLHLKRKLDALKASLPDPNDSPVPSPSEDAPSPTGSESPFHGLHRIGTPDPELDGQAMEEDLIALCDAPSPLSSPGDKDNRDVEDMELSDVEETEGPAIIVEEQLEQADSVDVSNQTADLPDPEPSQASQAVPLKQITTPAAKETPTTGSLPINLASVDLGKISSILSTLTNVMKSSATCSSTSTSSTPSPSNSSLKTDCTTSSSAAVPAASPLSSIVSRVDISPSSLISALSKTQAQGIGLQGLSSLLNTQTGMASAASGSDMGPPAGTVLIAHTHATSKTAAPTSVHSQAGGSSSQSSVPLRCTQSPNIVQTKGTQKETKKEVGEPITSITSSLDSKIDNFLQGNPGMRGLNMGFPSVLSWPKTIDSPTASTENLGGTPVRDESGATPTQDEVMDSPVAQLLLYQGGPRQTASTTSSLADTSAPPEQDFQSSVPLFVESEMGHQQENCLPPSSANNTLSTENSATMERNTSISEGVTAYPSTSNAVDNANLADDGWYGKTYGDVQDQNVMSNSESYRGEQYGSNESVQDFSPPNFFSSPLPPIPQLPPPPQDFLPQVVDGAKDRTKMPDSVNNIQDSSEGQACIPVNPVGFDDFDERISHQTQAKEFFHPLQKVLGPRLRDSVPLLVPPNGPVDYNHRPRIPVHHSNYPNMSHHSLSPPSTLRGYHEPLSPSGSPSEDPYFDTHYDPTAQSPSPPLYDVDHPRSTPSQMYYAEDRGLPPHHTEHGLPLHLEHRPPRPPHYRAPCPGHYLPQRPLHRPLLPHMPCPSEPPYLRGKRHGPPFGVAPCPGGPYFPPKRPFLPPRY
uniref:Regulation of nuclear pre-mRNA domain-containing protein 2 n=1 Tax=Electrophorus electricus TaxID=8005 RepID=A0A4W4EN91_ELEEL